VSQVPAYLEVWDIAGLVRGASEGEGTYSFVDHSMCCTLIAVF